MPAPVLVLAFANEKEESAHHLRGLAIEKNSILEALKPMVERKLLEVHCIDNATPDSIFDAFESQAFRDRIRIFHYAGHANSLQLLLETESGGTRSANAQGIMPFLASTASLKLLFFNACSTEEHSKYFIQPSADIRQRKVVISTSQSIKDDIAIQFSSRFYQSLSANQSIEDSFFSAEQFIKTMVGDANHRDLFFEEEEPEVETPQAIQSTQEQNDHKAWKFFNPFEGETLSPEEKKRRAIGWTILSDEPHIIKLVERKEYKKAINEIEDFARLVSKLDLNDKISHLEAEITDFEKQSRRGTMTPGTKLARDKQITQDLLDLLKEIYG